MPNDACINFQDSHCVPAALATLTLNWTRQTGSVFYTTAMIQVVTKPPRFQQGSERPIDLDSSLRFSTALNSKTITVAEHAQAIVIQTLWCNGISVTLQTANRLNFTTVQKTVTTTLITGLLTSLCVLLTTVRPTTMTELAWFV